MPYPYTPAQLAAFRTAIAILADGIAQGEKALSDEQFTRLMQAAAAEGRAPATTVSPKAPDTVTEQISQPKDGFTFLSWFKKKKIDAPAATNLARADSSNKPASVTPPTRKIPETFYFESSDTRIVSRFLADLPWSGKPQDAVIMSVGTSPATLTNERADNRNVSQFFSGLPWVSGGKSSAAPTVSVDNFVAPTKESFDIAGQSASLTTDAPARDQLAKVFFSGLPWQVADQKNNVVIETVSDQSKALPEKTITINRRETKPAGEASKTDQSITPSVKAYFSSLPWSPNRSPNKTGQSQPIQQLGQQPSGKEKALGDYFQSLPWDGSQQGSKSVPSKLDLTSTKEAQGIFALATQSALQASKKGKKNKSQPLQKDMANFFSDLPWNGSR